MNKNQPLALSGLRGISSRFFRLTPLVLALGSWLLPAPKSEGQVPPSYTLSFDDEFNGTSVDTTAWFYRTDATSRLQSAQLAANVSESGGYLHIAVKRQTVGSFSYTGGGVISNAGHGYGYYEARVKSPVGSGWHSSFWSMAFDSDYSASNANQEVDFMEEDSGDTVGYTPNYHAWTIPKTISGPEVPVVNPLQSNFNVIGCLYTPYETTYYLNGVQVWQIDTSSYPSNSANIWLTSVATTTPDASKLPSEMLVDWVHYYAPGTIGNAPPAPASTSVSIGATSVTLSWVKPVETVTFNIKRAAYSGGPYATIATGVTGTSYTDSGLSAGTPYYYVMSATNAGGVESANSPELSAVTGSTILDVAATSGITVSGTWTQTTYAPGYYGPYYLQDGNAGSGKSVTFTPTLANTGKYVIYARWPGGANRASNTPVDIVSASGTTTISLNEQTSNNVWVSLGTYTCNAGSTSSVKIRDDGANGYVIANAVMWVPQVPVTMTVTALSGTTESGTWTASTGVSGYVGGYYLFDSGTGSGAQSFTFTPTIPSTGSYKVYALWTAYSNRATNAPIDIFDGSSTTTVNVNQQTNNGTWVLLGTFSLSAGTSSYVKVRDNGANGYVVADGVMWVPQ